MPSSAIRLFFLNPFLPHPNAITIPLSPPTWISLTPQQLNSQHNAPISTPFFMESSCLIAKHLDEDQPVAFPSFLELLPARFAPHPIRLNYWVWFDSSPFLLLPSLETALETHSSCRGGLTSFQSRGWAGKATMSAIFPAKISQPPLLPESRGCCGACFVIKIRACVQLQCYC